jgi:hypothetical protein
VTGAGEHLAQRRAALAVHAMSPPDREWVLRELPSAQRDLLLPLLAELAELGIPQDAGLLGEVAVAPPAPSVARVDHPEEAALSARSARRLAHWLRNEPPQVGARLLNACPAWRVQLLRALPRSQQRSITSLVASLPPAPELERLVLTAAGRHLLADAVTSPISWLRQVVAPFAHREQR